MNDELPPGTIIGNNYRVLRTLGRGGFGITYKCEDIRLKYYVAVKEYFPDGLASRNSDNLNVVPSDTGRDTYKWGLEKFLREGMTLAAIQDKSPSEFIVKIILFLEERETAYLAMEFIDGMTIDEFATSNRVTSAKQLEGMFESLCVRGLKLIHEADVHHQDIKPDNIIVRSSNNQPVIIDFGAARQSAGGKSTVALLTPRYSAVEQYASKEDMDGDDDRDLCGPFTDIYSLAATFYFIIKGKLPHDAPSRILEDRTEALSGDKSLSHYSDNFLKQIDWGMSPLPKDRPQSIEQWVLPKEIDSKVTIPETSPNDAKVIVGIEKNSKQNIFKSLSLKLSETTLIQRGFGAFVIMAVLVNLIPDSSDIKTPTVAAPPPTSALVAKDTVRKTNEKRRKSPERKWVVNIDAVEWTPIKILPKLQKLKNDPSGTNFELKIYADEPFRIKTEKGFALTKKQSERFGGINGEVYLKTVLEKPQAVSIAIVESD